MGGVSRVGGVNMVSWSAWVGLVGWVESTWSVGVGGVSRVGGVNMVSWSGWG